MSAHARTPFRHLGKEGKKVKFSPFLLYIIFRTCSYRLNMALSLVKDSHISNFTSRDTIRRQRFPLVVELRKFLK